MLQQPWAFSRGVDPGRPRFLGQSLATAKPYYYFVLAILIVTIIVVRNVRNGGLGRLLIAIRDNEDGARAFTVPAQLVKLQGFVLAGFIAGLGGALYSHLLSQVSASAFTVDASINVVAMTLIGGTSLLVGPIIGAFYIIGIPAFLPLDSAGLASQQLGWLLLILYLPGGVAQGLEPARTRFVAWVTHRERDKLPRPALGEVASGSVRTELPTLAVSRVRRPPAGSVLLEGVDLRKRFGGVAAVDGVSMHVLEGEILGLIGPNGAGKTTTFEMLGGFIRPDDGRVIFEREDVSDLGPEERGQRGLIRSFQDAALFPTMTVLDVARLSFERVAPTRFLPSALGLRQGEQRKDRMARDLLGTMGLSAYANTTVEELSTGTRRIVEIACLIALQPALLLLDEPSSGIAQRETEALGELLRRMRDELQLTMLVIEHDIPLIMGLSDRIVAMDAGRVIATGTPLEIRSNPAVVEAYLGGAIDTVERSDVRAHNGAFPAIPGLSATRQAALLSTFGSVDELKKANVSDLMGVPGIGRTLAHRLVQALQ
jgi:ABC-type branched-subunit amino acid transport system ATPase component